MLLLSLTCLCLTQMTACQSISTAQTTVSNKITGLFGHNEKLPEIDPKGIVDISKATIEQYEQLSANLPLNQWVYLENEKQGIYQLQNKSTEGFVLSLRLNCKISSHPLRLSFKMRKANVSYTAMIKKQDRFSFYSTTKTTAIPLIHFNAKP